MDGLLLRMYNDHFSRVPYKHYPMLDALSDQIKRSDKTGFAYDLFNVDPKTMLSRYATNPYVDVAPQKSYELTSANFRDMINTGAIETMRTVKFADVPY